MSNRKGSLVQASIDALMVGGAHDVDFELDVDASSSMAKFEAMMRRVGDSIEQGLAHVDGVRISRNAFDREFYPLDNGQFAHPRELAVRSFSTLYRIGRGSRIERWMSQRIQLLLNRKDEARGVSRRNVVLFFTDGFDDATSPRADQVRQWMKELCEFALANGGFRNSPAAFWLCGMGYTYQRYLDVGRSYGIPDEWITHIDASNAGLQRLGAGVVESVTELRRHGGETVLRVGG